MDVRDTLPKLFPRELADRVNEDGYIEMPEPLVAAAATLISAFISPRPVVLDLWVKIYGLLIRDTSSGKRGWMFSTDSHHTTYLKHIRTLQRLKDENEGGFSVLLANIYQKSRLVGINQVFTLATDPRYDQWYDCT